MFSYDVSSFFTVVVTCNDQERARTLGFLIAKVGLVVTELC